VIDITTYKFYVSCLLYVGAKCRPGYLGPMECDFSFYSIGMKISILPVVIPAYAVKMDEKVWHENSIFLKDQEQVN